MVSTETLALINAFKSPVIELIKVAKDEVSYLIDSGLPDYIENLRSKFISTKTFLYRNENVNFYDVYFPVSLKTKDSIFKLEKNINDLFRRSRCITILGHAGSGKTMLMKHIFLETIYSMYRVPLVIELRSLNHFNGTLIDFIYQVIFNNKLAPSKRIVERLLEKGMFLFLLDGFDEIFSKRLQEITDDLDGFIDKYGHNEYLITSRPGANVESFPRFENYFVQKLDEKEIEEFIKQQLKYVEDEKLAKRIIETIRKPENTDYASYLSNPLLLSMFILTFNAYPVIPKSKSKFYYNVFDTLSTKHDSFTKKGGFQHERKSGLQTDQIEDILKWFSYLSFFEGKYSFDRQYLSEKLKTIKERLLYVFDVNTLIDDLTVAISIMIIDGLEYKFPHRSLQEYFTTLLIKDQSVENKEKIYKEKLYRYEGQTFEANESFYNLCTELDKIHFYKYFILFFLESLVEKVNILNRKEKIGLLLKELYFDHVINVGPDGTINESIITFVSRLAPKIFRYIGLGSYTHNFSLNKCNLDVLEQNLDDYIENGLIEEDNSLEEYFSYDSTPLEEYSEDELYSEEDENQQYSNPYNQYEISYFHKWSDEMYKLVCDIGLDVLILNFFDRVVDKMNEIKDQIKDEEQTKISLLDI